MDKLINKKKILEMAEMSFAELPTNKFKSYKQKLITDKLEEEFQKTLTEEQRKLYNEYIFELCMYHGEREIEALNYGINFIRKFFKYFCK